MLARAQELLQVAPSLDLLEAIKMAKTLPLSGQGPMHRERKITTIQGSCASSCIIAVPALVHQGVVNLLKEKADLKEGLQEVPSKQISTSVDRRNIVLRSTCTLSEDEITTFRLIVAEVCNTSIEECIYVNWPTYSTAKVEFLPYTKDITEEAIHHALMNTEVYITNYSASTVQLLPHPTNNSVQTALIKIYDYHNGTLLKKLCHESVTIRQDTQHIRPWINKPST